MLRRAVVAVIVACACTATTMAVASPSSDAPPARSTTARTKLLAHMAQEFTAHTDALTQLSNARPTTASFTDTTGDNDTPKTDITDITASYAPRAITLSARMAMPADPATDPLWTGQGNTLAGLAWELDTNNDGTPDYLVLFLGILDSNQVDVIRVPSFDSPPPDNLDDLVACTATESFHASTISFRIDTNCLQNPPRLRTAAATTVISMTSDTSDDDVAPNKGDVSVFSPPGGYVLAAADGGAFAYGTVHFAGSLGNVALAAPITAVSSRSDDRGYVMIGADGGVFPFGTAHYHGAPAAFPHGNERFVSVALTPSGNGYWVLGTSGGVYAFGDAKFFGAHVTTTAAAIAPTATGHGYWVADGDGKVHAFGDARDFGSMAHVALHAPIVSVMPTVSGRGYWLVGGDGGVFSFGDARFFGSTGAIKLRSPVVAARPTSTGRGYTMVAGDGGVFPFGDARFFGSAATLPLRQPIVAFSAH